jgi:hypothetical protein
LSSLRFAIYFRRVFSTEDLHRKWRQRNGEIVVLQTMVPPRIVSLS